MISWVSHEKREGAVARPMSVYDIVCKWDTSGVLLEVVSEDGCGLGEGFFLGK